MFCREPPCQRLERHSPVPSAVNEARCSGLIIHSHPPLRFGERIGPLRFGGTLRTMSSSSSENEDGKAASGELSHMAELFQQRREALDRHHSESDSARASKEVAAIPSRSVRIRRRPTSSLDARDSAADFASAPDVEALTAPPLGSQLCCEGRSLHCSDAHQVCAASESAAKPEVLEPFLLFVMH
jgi:hypothetical protein